MLEISLQGRENCPRLESWIKKNKKKKKLRRKNCWGDTQLGHPVHFLSFFFFSFFFSFISIWSKGETAGSYFNKWPPRTRRQNVKETKNLNSTSLFVFFYFPPQHPEIFTNWNVIKRNGRRVSGCGEGEGEREREREGARGTRERSSKPE